MKTNTFTKALLGIIALALVVIAGQGVLNHVTPVQAAATVTPYEYKFIVRTFSQNFKTGYAGETATWTEDGKTPRDEYNNNGGMGARIQDLGSQGWELATDVTYSQEMKTLPDAHIAANGVVTREEFIFKRRK